MKNLTKVMAVVAALAVTMGAMTGCGKKEEKNTSTPAPTTSAAVEATATPEATASSDKESENDTYKNTLMGITFEYTKGLYLEDATPKQMALMTALTEAGVLTEEGTYDIQRMQATENTQIAVLSAKDTANTTVTISLAPYATAEDVINAEATSAPEEAVREITVDEDFATKMSDSLKTAMEQEGRTLVGDVVTNIENEGTEEAPNNVVIMEYQYAGAAEATEAEYNVVHAIVPCGKNIINVVAMSKNAESKFDKVNLVQTITSTIEFGADLTTNGNIEEEKVEDDKTETSTETSTEANSTETAEANN